MQNYQSGFVILFKLPFSDAVIFKLPPELLLLDTGDVDISVARNRSLM